MRLIEKKCPNCGANLSFDENDKSCKCDYCKRAFEIQRDTDSLDKINLIYSNISNSVGKGFKFMSIIYFFIFFVVAITLSIISFSIFHKGEDMPSKIDINENAKDNVYLNKIEDITNFDYSFIDTTSKIAISREAKSTFYFNKIGDSKRVNIYLLHNDNGNILIPIYKDTYTNRETTHILYIPVLFENVRITNGSIAHDIGNAQISAPQYFFNNEQTEYAVGYQDLDTLYNDFIKKYETDYKIEKK